MVKLQLVEDSSFYLLQMGRNTVSLRYIFLIVLYKKCTTIFRQYNCTTKALSLTWKKYNIEASIEI